MKRLRRAVLAGLVMALLAVCQRSYPPGAAARAGEPHPSPIPSRGTATQLDVASWNIEWFGAPSNGPTDEGLQLAHARDVIRGTDADIWGLVEVVDGAAWDRLGAGLPGYTGVLANDRIVAGGAASYGSKEQKVGVLFKSRVATLVRARVILAGDDIAFAGRPPLEVTLRVTLNGVTEDLVVIVLHMKAFADRASWQRRRAAAGLLQHYLDTTWPTQKVIVIGDWNDDVDTSITRGSPTPFASLVAAPHRYRFLTARLSERRIASTTGYRELIDHHLATDELASAEVPRSAEVYRVDAFIPAYSETTSDHFPVLTHFTMRR
ncbi:MAG TPA: endonuclease/exonuclease/phosphatase family protein [Gemmatimonadaceae bacterium]|nr:endonuclease/exonuclease/phosphatase family protein [Gemmatimonadaceae bacterium]